MNPRVGGHVHALGRQEVVDNVHGSHMVGKQPAGEVAADESCAADDQNANGFRARSSLRVQAASGG